MHLYHTIFLLAGALGAVVDGQHPGQGIGHKSSSCQLERKGHGPDPPTDTPESFRDFQKLNTIALEATVPDGYTKSIENINGSVQPKDGVFLGVEFLEKYDAVQCSDFCNDHARCTAFNICVYLLLYLNTICAS